MTVRFLTRFFRKVHRMSNQFTPLQGHRAMLNGPDFSYVCGMLRVCHRDRRPSDSVIL